MEPDEPDESSSALSAFSVILSDLESFFLM